MDTVDLAIRMTSDADDAAAGFDRVGGAAAAMADDVAAASSQADAASRDLAGGVDSLGSASSKAAGGLGDLGGALAGVPGPLGDVGAGMTAAQPLIMGAAGAADLLGLAMESSKLATVKARAASIAHTAASKAQAAATKVVTAGQWLLNAAMSANPIGLAIAAAIALIALFVLLYKKSDTFREAVNKAGEVGKKALGFIVDKAQAVGDKVDNLLEPIGGVSGLVETLGEAGETAFNLWLTPLRTIIQLVRDLIGWIDKIDLPDLSGLPGLRAGAGTALPTGAGAGQVNVVNVTVQGAVDPTSTARQLRDLLRSYGIVLGAVAG